MKDFLKKLTLLLLAIPSAMLVTPLTSSALKIQEAYSGYNEALVTMILTIPNLSVILGSILAPIMIKKISIKSSILGGMIIFIVSSVLPFWCENLMLVLFFRAVCGVGAGIIIPLQVTYLVAYPEKQRAVLLGLSTTVACLVAAVVVSVSGWIAAFNWRYVFLLYLVNVIALVLAIFLLPRDVVQEEETAQAQASQEKLSNYSKALFVYFFLLIGSYLFVSILSAEMAPYVANVGLGGPEESGLLMSISLIGSLLAGMILGKYVQVLKKFSLPFVFVGAALTFFFLSVVQSLIPAGIAAFFVGVVCTLSVCVINYELSLILPLGLYTPVASALNIVNFGLQFLAPMLFIFLLNMFFQGSFRSILLLYALTQAVLAPVSYLLLRRLCIVK